MIIAKCVRSCAELELGRTYEVEYADVGTYYTSVYLKGFKKGFNSVCFEFFKEGKEIDIVSEVLTRTVGNQQTVCMLKCSVCGADCDGNTTLSINNKLLNQSIILHEILCPKCCESIIHLLKSKINGV